ncbi:MAG TPA: hypothetical protein DEF18_16295 [Muricauda sp.]|nr:hypothetical protein [Allomuricauda sp.]
MKILGLFGDNGLLLSFCCNGEKDFEEKHQNQVHSQNDDIVFHRIVIIWLNVSKTFEKNTMKCTFYR